MLPNEWKTANTVSINKNKEEQLTERLLFLIKIIDLISWLNSTNQRFANSSSIF